MPFTAILSSLKALFEPLIKPFAKKYFDQPHLYVILKKTAGGGKSPLGFSDKNPIVDGYMPITPDSIQYSKITTKFKMMIRNNSEHTAYNIKLLQPKMEGGLSINPAIDPFKPIIINGSDEYVFTAELIYEGKGIDAYNLYQTGLDTFKRNKIILEYTNVKRTKFYTLFDLNLEEQLRNTFHRRMPV